MTKIWNRFHDAGIVDFEIGPRREIRLQVHVLQRDRGPRLQMRAASIRFSAIENYETVTNFLGQLERSSIPDAYVDEIDSISVTPTGWNMTLNVAGSVRIDSRKPPKIDWEKAI